MWLLSWIALVAPARWVDAGEAPTRSRSRQTHSALLLNRDGLSIPDDATAAADYDASQAAAQSVPYIARQQADAAAEPPATQPPETIEPQPADDAGPLLNPDGAELLEAPAGDYHFVGDPLAPAPAVSSGNWLRSCCWYTEQSVVYMTRTANIKNDVRLAAEIIPFTNPQVISNTLDVQLDPGFEPGLRSTWGLLLGQDARNRTHSVEFTFLGLTHWQAGESLVAQIPGTIDQFIDRNIVVPVYDGSDEQAFDQTSDLNSYEFNYRIERRLGRDRLVYSRNSRWVREATPSLLCSAFAGLRAVFVNERLGWTASSQEDGTGRYLVATHNNMVGPQVGAEVFYERAYWRFGVRTTAGALVNWASQSSRVNILDNNGQPLVPNRDEFAKQHTLAFAGGFNFVGEYRFRPRFGLRVSYDLLFLTDQALAQNQLTFFPSTPPQISDSHSLFFQGVSLGFEWVR